jgi:hypothetical protein
VSKDSGKIGRAALARPAAFVKVVFTKPAILPQPAPDAGRARR